MDEPTRHEVIVEILRRVTSDVLSTMLSLEALPEEPFTEQQAPANSDGIVSFVGLAGNDCVGTGSLHCDSQAACRLASSFLMSEIVTVDDEVLDAFGELANMIIGNFKNEVEQYTGPMGLSVPTVIHGRNFSTRSLGQEEWIVVPFLCGDDRLHVKVCLKHKKGGRKVLSPWRKTRVYSRTVIRWRKSSSRLARVAARFEE